MISTALDQRRVARARLLRSRPPATPGTSPRNPGVRNAPLPLPGFTQADQDAELRRDQEAERRLLPATLLVVLVIALIGVVNLLTQ